MGFLEPSSTALQSIHQFSLSFYSSNYSSSTMFGYNKPCPRPRSRSRSRSRNRNRARTVEKFRPAVSGSTDYEADDESTQCSSSALTKLDNMALTTLAPTTVAVPESFKLCVQLAQGSPMALIPSTGSISELFNSIALAFGIDESEIIFCTVNSFKVDMNAIFSGSLGFSDILFVHVKGQPIEVEMNKTESALGITIGDNGMCRSYVKKVKEDGLADKLDGAIRAGQLIEKINNYPMLGLRHYEVAKVIRNIPLGATFTMRLVNPLESGFSFIKPRGAQAKQAANLGNGSQTIRFKATGGMVVQEKADLPDEVLISQLNDIFESYLGIQDNELAISLWETAVKCATLQEMMQSVRNSELKIFDFPDELIFDLFGIVSDWKKANKSAGSPAEDDYEGELAKKMDRLTIEELE